MEFFIPGLFLFVVTILISFFVAPKITPLIAAILSIGFLTFGVYEHYKMFATEYRLSTWQDGLKIYAPAIMIFAILLFIIYAIFAFFTKGSVPIPKLPTIMGPSENTFTDKFVNTVNTAMNNVTNIGNEIGNEIGNGNRNGNRGNNGNRNKNNGSNNISRSILETI